MKSAYFLPILLGAMITTIGCTPKVEVRVPNEPITINLNVKIEHEILIKVDKEIDSLISNRDDIF